MGIGEEVKFKCTIVNERYYNSDSSFGVFVFHTKDNIPEYDEIQSSQFYGDCKDKKISTLAGNMQQLYIGSEYEVTALLDYNSKYKTYQYKPKIITSVIPKTEAQQKKFLLSIITENQADTLVTAYPNIVEEIINGSDNVDVSKLKGIGDKTYKKIKEKVLENYVISDILVMFQPLGVTYNKIKKLLANEPNPTLLKEKLINNPYIMQEIKGFGFKTVDKIAIELNPEIKVSSKRVYAFIKNYLKDLGNDEGHTWTTVETLRSLVRDNINECIEVFEDVIKNEQEKEIVLHFDGDRVGLKSYYLSEKNVFDSLQRLKKSQLLEVTNEDIKAGILQSEKDQGFNFTNEQLDVIKNSTKENVIIITGKAGTGKSSITRAILNIYKHANYSISCCALSAMAAQRITEATGFKASTIHRLLGYDKRGFCFNSNIPLPSDVIFIDECSMINSYIYEAIVTAIKDGEKIIMCGDNRQLPPIGYGNIFGDLLDKKDDFSIFKLTKVLRQAEKSGILTDANKIRDGILPIKQPELKIISGELQDMTYMFRDTRESLNQIAIKTYLKAIETEGTDNVVIITPRRENCENSSNEINKKIVDLIADKTKKSVQYGDKNYYIGTKVMQTTNDYDKNVFNGEIGYVKDIYSVNSDGSGQVLVDIEFKTSEDSKVVTYQKGELQNIDLAYAMTGHKIQGQGIKSVIIIIDMTHYTLLDTCLLYTAITRAKKRCLLLAEPMAFKMCMENNKSKNRHTWLSLM